MSLLLATLRAAAGMLALLLAGAYGVAVLHGWLATPRRPLQACVWPLAAAVKALRRPALTPEHADGGLFRSAPLLAFVCVYLATVVLPLGPGLGARDLTMGLFYFMVVLGPVVVALMNAGWGANGKYGLLGCFRAAAQLLAYEVPLGFAAIGPVMAAQSLSTGRIVAAQTVLWFGLQQPLGFVLYMVAAMIMSYRAPFDLPLAGSELAGGVLAELSGARYVVMQLALYGLVFDVAAMGTVLFLGGWLGPLLPAPAWFLLKTAGLAAVFLSGHRAGPRLRLDQMLAFSWKILLPLSLLNMMVVGVTILLVYGAGGGGMVR